MAAVGQLQATADVDTRQEQEDAFCELMRFIREDLEACELTEKDPVTYMGEFLDEQARSVAAIHLCILVKKLRVVDTADRASLVHFILE